MEPVSGDESLLKSGPGDEPVAYFPPLLKHRLEFAPFGLEPLIAYQSGGFHPVNLGDFLGEEERYRVLAKLGHGGFATVWLCVDTLEAASRYVAVKILMAQGSIDDYPELHIGKIRALLGSKDEDAEAIATISFPIDQFKLTGPNGKHCCFVYEVHGPKVNSDMILHPASDAKSLKTFCLSVVQAVGSLHVNGICHGDITASNILYQTRGLDRLNEKELLDLLGQPRRNPVTSNSPSDGEAITTGLPDYLVWPVKWGEAAQEYLDYRPALIDFGEWYEATTPPEELGIPGPYRAPELILDQTVGIGADLWALGCTLFTIRTGRKFFGSFDNHGDEYVEGMMRILGKLPEPWWSTWEFRLKHYEDDVDNEGRAVPLVPDEDDDDDDESVGCHPSLARGARSIKEKLAPGLWHMPEMAEWTHREISKEKIEVFADLLGKLLRFDPKERISALEVADHEWFKMQ